MKSKFIKQLHRKASNGYSQGWCLIELHREYCGTVIIAMTLETLPLIVSESCKLFSNWKAYFFRTEIRGYKASFFPPWSSLARCFTEQQRGRRRNEWRDRLKLAIMAKQIWDISTLQRAVQIIACFRDIEITEEEDVPLVFEL